MRSSWRPAASSVPQELILLNIFINDLDDATEHTLRRFAGVTKLGGAGNASYGCAAIQRDLSRVEKWVNRIRLKFRKGKCQVLHLGRKSEAPQKVLKHYLTTFFFVEVQATEVSLYMPFAFVSCRSSTWSSSAVKAGAVWTTSNYYFHFWVCDTCYLTMEELFNFWCLEDWSEASGTS